MYSFLRRVIWSLNYRFWRIPIFHRFKIYNTNIKNLVVSPGGVGTTFVMEYLEKFIILNNKSDRDQLKHIPNVPFSLNKNIKILFITSDFEEIYSSLNKRDWVKYNALKLGSPMSKLYKKEKLKKVFYKLVLKQKKAFESSKKNPILIIEYNDIWKRKKEIMHHFKISDFNFLKNFPLRKERTSIKE